MNVISRVGDNSLNAAIEEMRALLADRLSTTQAVREQHGKDLTWHAGRSPDAVAFVETTQEVSAIVKICDRYQVPVIAFGTGTSLEGHITAPYGGVTIDLTGMNQVVEVNPQDLDCTVQAGVTRKQLNEYLRDTGLFFPIDPGADASIGGMASTRASGTNAVRYGTMRENVLSVTAVMANGEIVRTARRARKSSAGYDLTKLLVGSEGTLGVITEITLRLHGIPEAISGGTCTFPDVKSACDAVIQTIQCGIPVARIELLDALQVRACNEYSGLGLEEVPTLFLEFHGSEASVREQSEMFGEIAKDQGGGEFNWATKAEDRNKLWSARHDVFWAVMALAPGKKAFATDVCVPISRLADCVEATQEDIREAGLVAPIVGHVGDGNFHVSLLLDVEDPSDIEQAEVFVKRLVMRALEMDGTCTGEHGVGIGKMKFMEAEHGNGLQVMRSIKAALDPKNIMNPGKVLAGGT